MGDTAGAAVDIRRAGSQNSVTDSTMRSWTPLKTLALFLV
jgi:hypothetical protein